MKPSEDKKRAELYRMVTDEHICPFGLKAKDLLERRGFSVDDIELKTREETDAFKAEHGVESTPQTFIDGERIGGYEELREHFGMETKDEDELSYQPVVAVFAMTLSMALAATWASTGTIATAQAVEWFVAFSMCVLATLKLRDLESFSNQFVTYDLLARRFVRYAYVYPFAEAFAGVGMIAGAFTTVVAPVALSIGGVGAISVIKAVYIDKRELRCACVGGNSNVPLGFISLTENVMMVGMGLRMLFA